MQPQRLRLQRPRPQHQASPRPLRAVSSCRRPARGPSIPRRRRLRLRPQVPRHRTPAESSVGARSSTGGLPEVQDSVPVVPELQAAPEPVAPCTRRAPRRPALLREHVPGSGSAPAWVRGPALDSVPVVPELPALFRLRVKHHGHRVRVMVRGVAARLTKRPRKAR